MKLDVITVLPPKTHPSRSPLLFIHGSFSDARVWEPTFLPYFARHGFECHAVSLRGHGNSEGREELRATRLADYVDDVTAAVSRLPRSPILIGHSMGGMVAQKYAQRHPNRLAGMVLMGSVPPHGLACSNMFMALRHPLSFCQTIALTMLGPRGGSLETMRRLLFSADMPEAKLLEIASFVQAESVAVAFDMLRPPIHHSDLPFPTLVVGAQNDVFVAPAVAKATARYYRADFCIIPELAHAMMLDTRWQDAADVVLGWIERRVAQNAEENAHEYSPVGVGSELHSGA